ncbi:MCE family protein [Actinomadura barringtoniae]|uniref:MCE family protein n=1 Tax=Actinomadura barringtoniae TaxID=1427535 RepID=A0A939TAW3_9ACTN|nr:MCE family protein [Actinomadura barringtoniae]MBO2455889.1 MCE family protein [Actinomadura barringtoniae]
MRHRKLAGPLIKSLLFVAFTGLATTILAVSIAQVNVGATHSYSARFTDASGLHSGDSVRIAGVQIGRVDKVGVTDRRLAKVTFSIEKDRTLPATVTATIKYVNLVGQRYVELDRGAGVPGAGAGGGAGGGGGAGAGELRPGSTIPVERTKPALDLTELFNGFRPLMQALSPGDVNKLADSIIQVFQGEGSTMETLLSTVGSLTSTLASKDQVIGQVVGNLNSVIEDLNGRSDKVVGLVTTLRRLVSGLAEDRGPIGEAIGALDDLTQSTAGLLQDGRAPLKKDVDRLGRLSQNLADESSTVEKFLNTLPVKMQAIGRLGSYGSWMNLYLCEADLHGVTYKQYPDAKPSPPTGIPVTAARCKS